MKIWPTMPIKLLPWHRYLDCDKNRVQRDENDMHTASGFSLIRFSIKLKKKKNKNEWKHSLLFCSLNSIIIYCHCSDIQIWHKRTLAYEKMLCMNWRLFSPFSGKISKWYIEIRLTCVRSVRNDCLLTLPKENCLEIALNPRIYAIRDLRNNLSIYSSSFFSHPICFFLLQRFSWEFVVFVLSVVPYTKYPYFGTTDAPF